MPPHQHAEGSRRNGRTYIRATPVTATTKPDVTPPRPPYLYPVHQTSTGAKFLWFSNGDNDVTGSFDFLVSNGTQEVVVAGFTHTFNGLTPGVTYTFTVRMRDRSGNVSAPSNAFTFTMDATPPSVPTGLVFNPDARHLTFQPSTDNLDNWVRYAVYANGERVNLNFPPAGAYPLVDLGLEIQDGNTIPDGLYTVTAEDRSGNVSAHSDPVEVDL